MKDPRASAFRRTWSRQSEQVPVSFFDRLYASHEDPWALGERWYEARKYELTLAALPNPRYRSALEVGCSVGLLTERLALRCDALLAGDIAAAAVETARRRLAARQQGNVTVRQMAPPDDWPEGSFDLIVLSEVLYFTRGPRLERFIEGAVRRLAPDGHLLAVHYRPATDVHLVGGDFVHRRLAAQPELHRRVSHLEDSFLLEVFARVPPG